MKWLIALSLFFSLCLFADDNIDELNFPILHDRQQMERLNGKKVKIKGFLYTNLKKEWVLSAEPHLKTCCVGSKGKVEQQIFLDGIFNDKMINRIIEMEGIFKFDPLEKEGHRYFLSEITMLNKNTNYVSLALGMLGIILIACCVTKY